MKAKVVQRLIYEGTMDWIHGGGTEVKYLVFENIDTGIAIVDGRIIVYVGIGKDIDDKEIGQVDVPFEIFDIVAGYAIQKRLLDRWQDEIEILVK